VSAANGGVWTVWVVVLCASWSHPLSPLHVVGVFIGWFAASCILRGVEWLFATYEIRRRRHGR
jgi:hypothetical protein